MEKHQLKQNAEQENEEQKKYGIDEASNPERVDEGKASEGSSRGQVHNLDEEKLDKIAEKTNNDSRDDVVSDADQIAKSEESKTEIDQGEEFSDTDTTESEEEEANPDNLQTEKKEVSQDVAEMKSEGENADTENTDTENKEQAEDEEDDSGEHDEDSDEEEDEADDFSQYDKQQLVRITEALLKEDDVRRAFQKLKAIKQHFDEIRSSDRQSAYQKYIEEGGEKDGFEYRKDDLEVRFDEAYKTIKEKRERFIQELEKNKDSNLVAKNQILEKLRNLVDSEETTTSIGVLKKIQEEWRSIGPVPKQYVKSLWANYSALIDRFYDNRSIYFELKELDRKKNLESKLELCEKAEQLENVENIKDAIKQLNELHEEFKHIGPVPKDDQEPLWNRFKSASDQVYVRRKEFVEGLKEELGENLVKKQKLGDEVASFADYDSDRITDWNNKTKEILELQKQWEAIGGLPREHAKATNKKFWSSFKKFFNNKSAFFKKLEGQRDENLKLKQELLRQAEELRGSEEWEKTANKLKDLQKEWKDVGPVPEKYKNEIYQQFKQACDEFFERRRESRRHVEKEFEENLQKKLSICKQIEELAEQENADIEQFEDLVDEYNQIGFVPKNAIKSTQKVFNEAIKKFTNKADDLSDDEKQELVISAQYQKMKSSPNANRKIQRKENSIKKQIDMLENDIALWKNNIEFFADTKTGEKVKADFNDKISKAKKELKNLKQQLKIIQEI